MTNTANNVEDLAQQNKTKQKIHDTRVLGFPPLPPFSFKHFNFLIPAIKTDHNELSASKCDTMLLVI